MSTNALNDAIYQNTPGNSQGDPLGLSWDTGVYGTHTETPAPAGFSAVTGWGVVYQQAGASVSPNAASDTVQIANYTTYLHLTNGTWVEVQSQAQDGIGGAHFVADFSGNGNIPWQQQNLSDGSVSVDAPPSGYNDHFWPGVRGTFTPGTVDGVFVEADMKTNDPSANLVAQMGADWWLNAGADYGDGSNNPVVGGGDFVKLTTQYQTVYYSSLSAAQLTADPPPGVTSTTASGGTSSSGTSSSGTTSGGTSATGPTGSTSSGTTTASGGTSSSGTTSSGTTVTDPTGTTSSGGSNGSSSSGTSGPGTTTPTTPVAPSLTVADKSLSVSPGGSVSLGLGVTVPNAGDNVSVTISGLPRYETITDNLDHKTFSGSSVTLTAAEVNSGVTLNSSYHGRGHPTATLTVTAHDATGTPVTSAAQTITVQDPPATTTTSGSSGNAGSGASTTTSGSGTSSDQHHWGDPRGVAAAGSGSPAAPSSPCSGHWSPGRANIAQWFSDHPDFAPAAATLSDAGASRPSWTSAAAPATANPAPSASSTAYALLNQMMARDFGSDSHFAQAATALSALPQQQLGLLTTPVH